MLYWDSQTIARARERGIAYKLRWALRLPESQEAARTIADVMERNLRLACEDYPPAGSGPEWRAFDRLIGTSLTRVED